MANRKIIPNSEVVLWSTIERDGSTHLLRRRSGETALVTWDNGQKAWECSECGLHLSRGAAITCAHVQAATRDMPASLAVQLAGATAQARTAPAATPYSEPVETQRSTTGALAAGAEARARLAAEHDQTFRPVVGEVVVRQATDADRAKLQTARERKKGIFEARIRERRFVG